MWTGPSLEEINSQALRKELDRKAQKASTHWTKDTLQSLGDLTLRPDLPRQTVPVSQCQNCNAYKLDVSNNGYHDFVGMLNLKAKWATGPKGCLIISPGILLEHLPLVHTWAKAHPGQGWSFSPCSNAISWR